MVGITVDLKDLPGYMDTIAKEQLPFAAALTVTRLAMKAADLGVKVANQRMNITNSSGNYFRNAEHCSKGKEPSGKKAFASLMCDKHTPMDKMQAVAGVVHWGVAQMAGETWIERTTKTARYRWIPLKGRKGRRYGVRNAYPGDGDKSKGNFFMKSRKGNYMIVTRAGRSRKLTPIFIRKKRQNIKPLFSLAKLSENIVNKYKDAVFEKAFEQALRTARPKK